MTISAAERIWDWNQANPIGTRVVVYPGARDGAAIATATRSAAWVMPNDAPVVAVKGYPGGIHLDNVDMVRPVEPVGDLAAAVEAAYLALERWNGEDGSLVIASIARNLRVALEESR